MSSELAGRHVVGVPPAGNVDAFTAELREYCVLVARHYGATQWAEDVAQDAMLAFLTTNGVTQPHAWLRTVVRRLVARRLRDSHPFVSLDRLADDWGARLAEPSDRGVLLRQVLGRLSTRDRRVLMLKLRGYSYSEMAGRLGCHTNAVGTLVNRAFARSRRFAHG
ncbi:MAG: RNA polymerase sigma factor [Thermoanaerobaculia bacterium]